MDIRTHAKECERYLEQAKTMGINFLRARPHSIEPGPGNIGVTMRYTTEDGQIIDEDFDMAVLSIGMEPAADSQKLAKLFNIDIDPYRFAVTSDTNPVLSSRAGVFVTGAFQAPKSIPRSVTEASAAAAEAAGTLINARGTLTREKTYPEEQDVEGKEPRIGVFVCSCGINIAGTVDVKAVTEYARTLPNVVYVENNLFTCAADTQDLISQKIKENDLNRIVIAACTPRTHEPLFQDTMKEAGLNAFLMEMANIRNQNSWVHQNQPEKATEKAKDQVRMAIAKAGKNVALQQLKVDVVQKALVIGGGIAGMHASLSLADQNYETVLIEKSNQLGGNALNLERTVQGEAIRPMLKKLIDQVENHPRITLFKNAQLKTATGSVGNFVSKVDVDGQTRAVVYGVAVLATGAGEATPDEYLYNEDSRVMTHLEFDRHLKENIDSG
jgi:heterodisulfide reductase subunit A2